MAGKKEAQQKEQMPTQRQRRSPGRRATSPGRKRSPARSPGRKKTPPRQPATPVSPSRSSTRLRSPARASKSLQNAKVVTQNEAATTSKKERFIPLDSDSDTPEMPREAKEKPKIAVRGRSRNADISRDSLKGLNDFLKDRNLESDSIKPLTSVLRRSTRSSQSTEVERVVHLTKYEIQTQKLAEFSDDDETAQLKSAEDDKGSQQKMLIEFGGTLGACFGIVLLPLFVYGLHAWCNEKQCSFTRLPDLEQLKNVSTYFDFKTSLVYVAFLILLGLLTAFPFGGEKVSGLPNKHEKLIYTGNAPFCLIILVMLAVLLNYYGIKVVKFINYHYFHFIFPAFLFGIVLSVYAYIKSFYVPVSALATNSSFYTNRIYNFFMGREVSPRLLGVLDLKIFAFRTGIIGTLILSTACFFESVKPPESSQANFVVYGANVRLPTVEPTITTLYILIGFYCLDSMFFETQLLSSFQIQYEGFGYMSAVGLCLYPFFLSSIVRYVHYYKVQLGYLLLAIIALVFLSGYILYRKSNSQKNAFRKNPYSPSVAHLETISTNQGKKLIISGLWGVVRKPNYLGDILMHLALVPFVYNVPPVLFLVFTVLLLIHRTVRDNAHCKQKYGGSWERYCLKVRYVLLPKLY